VYISLSLSLSLLRSSDLQACTVFYWVFCVWAGSIKCYPSQPWWLLGRERPKRRNDTWYLIHSQGGLGHSTIWGCYVKCNARRYLLLLAGGGEEEEEGGGVMRPGEGRGFEESRRTTVRSSFRESEATMHWTTSPPLLPDDIAGTRDLFRKFLFRTVMGAPDIFDTPRHIWRGRVFLRFDQNDPTASFLSFLAWVTHDFFRNLRNDIFVTNWLVFLTFFLHEVVCLFSVRIAARASTHDRHILVFVVSKFSVGNDSDKS